VFATAAALASPTIGFLLACRVLQAATSAGIIVTRAVISDTGGSAPVGARLAHLTMGMTWRQC
jgi:DHA1 family bicyclomycin/chloramphenicol resistance-like MFS transporter